MVENWIEAVDLA